MFNDQLSLFDDPVVPQNTTTAIYPNRKKDKARVEVSLGLPEIFNGESISLKTKAGTLVAQSYVRIVYGDHGPYIEFEKNQILCGIRPKYHRTPPPDAYYEWLEPTDGSGVKIYDQKRDVKHLKNPPPGGFRGNRAEGYADYKPGMMYISPWELLTK